MTIMITTPTEPTRHILTLNLPKKKPTPDTTNKDTPKQRFISLPNMVRGNWLPGTINIQPGTPTKTFPSIKIRRNLIPPSTNNSSTKVLSRTRQIVQKRQTRPIPTQFLTNPTRTNLSRTLNKQMSRTMARTSAALPNKR